MLHCNKIQWISYIKHEHNNATFTSYLVHFICIFFINLNFFFQYYKNRSGFLNWKFGLNCITRRKPHQLILLPYYMYYCTLSLYVCSIYFFSFLIDKTVIWIHFVSSLLLSKLGSLDNADNLPQPGRKYVLFQEENESLPLDRIILKITAGSQLLTPSPPNPQRLTWSTKMQVSAL